MAKTRVTAAIRARAVQDIVGGMTYVRAARKYKVAPGTIKNWMRGKSIAVPVMGLGGGTGVGGGTGTGAGGTGGGTGGGDEAAFGFDANAEIARLTQENIVLMKLVKQFAAQGILA